MGTVGARKLLKKVTTKEDLRKRLNQPQND